MSAWRARITRLHASRWLDGQDVWFLDCAASLLFFSASDCEQLAEVIHNLHSTRRLRHSSLARWRRVVAVFRLVLVFVRQFFDQLRYNRLQICLGFFPRSAQRTAKVNFV
jgi:hypothetical protein